MKALIAVLVLSVATIADANSTTSEVLVLTTATEITRTRAPSGRRVAIEIQNLGPNAIFCAFTSGTAVVNKARMIAAKPASGPADSWAIDAGAPVRIFCIAATANQVTGAATAVSELLN